MDSRQHAVHHYLWHCQNVKSSLSGLNTCSGTIEINYTKVLLPLHPLTAAGAMPTCHPASAMHDKAMILRPHYLELHLLHVPYLVCTPNMHLLAAMTLVCE